MTACVALTCCVLWATPDTATLYGHRAYSIVKPSEVVSVGNYRSTARVVKLLPCAAAAFREMQEAAHRDAIKIIPISGYRGFAQQRYLFGRGVKEYGSRESAARRYAPPGYSEHHTGLALDLGDQVHPECDLLPCFQKTHAYAWLAKNASRFGFELSFPTEREEMSFEPWHWRFIGNADSLKVFRTP